MLPMLIAAGLTAAGAAQQNAANSAQSAEQMSFQREMSGTAHQRQVEDLKRAGLNPILAAGGSGASSPQGAQASMENPLEGAASAVRMSQQQDNEDKLAKENVENIQTDTQRLSEAKTGQKLDNEVTAAQMPYIKARAKLDKDYVKEEKIINMVHSAASAVNPLSAIIQRGSALKQGAERLKQNGLKGWKVP